MKWYDYLKEEWIPIEKGKIVKFPETGDHEFYIHKFLDLWRVTDSRSGSSIGTDRLRAKALKLAKYNLVTAGAKKFHRLSRKEAKRIKAVHKDTVASQVRTPEGEK